MSTYRFMVEVETDTAEHAALVMRERLTYDEVLEDDDGEEFEYTIDYALYPVSIDGEAT